MWIGLDVGTTAVKAAAYRADGTRLAVADAPSNVNRSSQGFSEQDMEGVWLKVVAVLNELAGRIDASKVESIGIAAQGDGLWLVDKDGQPAAPAMLWNDTRAARDVHDLALSGASKAVAHGCHTSLWAGTSGTLWRWLHKNKKSVTEKAAAAFTCADWVGCKLTGTVATDFSNASIPFLDFKARAYGADQLTALDCEDLQELLPAPRKASEKLGTLSNDAADQVGLPAGIPVSIGTLDLSAMILGMGMDQPGQAMMIIGTTAVVNILTDHVEPSDEPVGASVLHPTSDAIIRVLAPTTGAAAFDWFANLHPMSLAGENSEAIANKFNELVGQVPAGSNGVVFLPYLNGERAPFVDADITASFVGMRSTTKTADLARAVMEGTGFSLLHCITEEGGLPEGAIQLTGGGSRNPVWCQIIADIVGRPIEVSSASDQGLWGAACLGAAAAGKGDAISLVSRDEDIRTYNPDDTRHADYANHFERYRIYSDANRQTSAKLRALGDQL